MCMESAPLPILVIALLMVAVVGYVFMEQKRRLPMEMTPASSRIRKQRILTVVIFAIAFIAIVVLYVTGWSNNINCPSPCLI